jgi:ketosteroid isomerase-like protein
MSEANVELVRITTEQFLTTGELRSEWLDHKIEVVDHDIPDAGTYIGHEGFARWLADWDEPWESYTVDIERYVDGGERVVILLLLTAKGKGSGAEVQRHDAMVWTVRDGKAVRLDYYNDQSQALAAAGVE